MRRAELILAAVAALVAGGAVAAAPGSERGAKPTLTVRRAGQILCQNVREFGGLWLVVRPSGAFVR